MRSLRTGRLTPGTKTFVPTRTFKKIYGIVYALEKYTRLF